MAKKQDSLSDSVVGLIVTQGVIGILFGIAALFWPDTTVRVFAVLFGAFVLVWGIALLIQSLFNMSKWHLWWLELIFGILILGLGVFLVRNPGVTLAWLILMVGFTFIVRGIVDVIEAFFSKDEAVKNSRWIYVFSALVSVIAGVVVLLHPVASGLAFIWIVGLYAIIEGVILIVLAKRFRELSEA